MSMRTSSILEYASLIAPALSNQSGFLLWHLSEDGNLSHQTIIPPRLGLPSNPAPKLTFGPFIQRPEQGVSEVVWETDILSDSVVTYGLRDQLEFRVSSSLLTKHHALRLQGLSAERRYRYRIQSANRDIADGSFFSLVPPPSSDSESFRFVVFGDSRGNEVEKPSENARKVATLIESLDPQFMIHTGDLVPLGAHNEYASHFFEPFGATVSRIPFFPAIGNHETYRAKAQAYLDIFNLPKNGSDPERYYSFDIANAHFVALDTETSPYESGSQQVLWLESDLKSVDKRWRFAFFHRPSYCADYVNPSDNSHASDLVARNSFEPLFEKYGVQLAFGGHTHGYQRTKAIRDYYPEKDGTVHVVTAGGGAYMKPLASNESFIEFASSYAYHAVLVEGTRDHLLVRAIDVNGSMFDSFVISQTDDGEHWNSNSLDWSVLENKVKNPGFERGDDVPWYWNTYWFPKDFTVFKNVEQEGTGLNSSLRVDFDTHSGFDVRQTVGGLKSGALYALRGRIRAEEIKYGAFLEVHDVDKTENSLIVRTNTIRGTSDWKTVEAIFQLPDGLTDVGLSLRAGARHDLPLSKERVWFDDCELIELAPPLRR